MRRWMLASSMIGAALLAAVEASAAPLLSATWTQSLQGVEVTVTVSGSACTSTGANIVQQMITCATGSGLNPTGTATSSAYNVSLTLPAFALTQYTTGGAINIKTIASIPGGQQTITGNQSAANAIGKLPGAVTVRVAAHAAKGVNASLLTAAPTTLVKVPLSIGRAGMVTGYFYVLTNVHYITVNFYAWTPRTLSFTGLTTKGAALPDVVAMGSFDFIAIPEASKIPASEVVFGYFGSVALTLVAPSRISIDGPLAQRRTASFTSLKLDFPNELGAVHGTPEPGTWLLLGAGLAGLLLAQRCAS